MQQMFGNGVNIHKVVAVIWWQLRFFARIFD